MINDKIAFIGCGNMAASLIRGLVKKRDPKTIWATALTEAELEKSKAEFGIHCSLDNSAVLAEAATVVLAVKPHQIEAVCKTMGDAVQMHRPLVVSVAAGIKGAQIGEWLGGGNVPIVRTMPNTPCAVAEGVTALLANQYVTDKQKQIVEALFQTVGLALWVDDDQKMDVVTALSGSGPAYVFLFMEALEKAAVEAGLDKNAAKLMTQQLMLGAARMAISSDEDVAQLRVNVTSPGGSTEQALRVFEQHSFQQIVKKAFNAARDRAEEMSELASKKI